MIEYPIIHSHTLLLLLPVHMVELSFNFDFLNNLFSARQCQDPSGIRKVKIDIVHTKTPFVIWFMPFNFHLIFRSMDYGKSVSKAETIGARNLKLSYNALLQSLRGSKKVLHFEYRVYNPHRQTVDWYHYPQGNSWGARVVVFKIFRFVSNFNMMKTDTFCFVFSACRVILLFQ